MRPLDVLMRGEHAERKGVSDGAALQCASMRHY
jgi:hypothetical protein